MCGRGQPYMNVFNMMSGQMTPHSISLLDSNRIKEILFKTRKVFNINQIFSITVIGIAFSIAFGSFLLKDTSIKIILIAIPHSLFYCLCCHYLVNIIYSQIFYFYIICYYLKLKQREVNNYLRKVIKNN